MPTSTREEVQPNSSVLFKPRLILNLFTFEFQKVALPPITMATAFVLRRSHPLDTLGLSRLFPTKLLDT